MSLLLRGLLDDIAAAGGLKGKVHREALDRVDAFARGETLTSEEIARARSDVKTFVGRIGSSAPLMVALTHVPVELVLRMVETGEDLSEHVRDHAVHVVAGRLAGDPEKRVEALLARARELAAAIDDAVPAAPPEEDHGRVVALDLPAIALAYLASGKAARSGKHGDDAATRALLAARGQPAHPAVLEFEAAYGGLELFESDPHAPALTVGPYAFFSAAPQYTGRHEGLVPVIFAWDDVYYALDAKGRGLTCAAMVEGVFRPSANDGRALLTQAILWRALGTHPAGMVTREGLHGAAMAKERGLRRVAGASGKTERWWGDAQGMRLVVEIDRGNGNARAMTYATGEG